MATDSKRALKPEDLTRLFVEFGNAGDAEGLASLYERDATVAFPPGKLTVGHDAIKALHEHMPAAKPHGSGWDRRRAPLRINSKVGEANRSWARRPVRASQPHRPACAERVLD